MGWWEMGSDRANLLILWEMGLGVGDVGVGDGVGPSQLIDFK
jgi:hypothetical protein